MNWMLDARAECQTCGWNAQGKNAQGLGGIHKKKTGHRVTGELYYAFDLDR